MADHDNNPDPITGASGSHPTGVGIGSASGAATGAAIGMLGGPIGAVIGAIAGGISGGYVGKGVGEKVDPTEDDTYWRGEHRNRSYVSKDYDYDRDLSPAYQYGSTIGLHADSDHDRPVSATGSTGAGVGDSIKAAGSKIADGARDLKDKVTGGGDGATGTTGSTGTGGRLDFDQHEADIRAGWDKVRGKSNLDYEQARSAIRDAFDRKLQLREERLNVGKERVQTGEASIRKEIITEHQRVDVPLQREELVIERRPVAGSTTAAGTIGEAETIRVPLSEERATVSKNTVVTEDVSIGKKVLTDTKTVDADVKKEQLKVDDAKRSTRTDR